MTHESVALAGLGLVALPATCGELVQGTLDGVPCLVSCPIGRYSLAEVSIQPQPGWDVPPHMSKAVAALHAGLAHLDWSEFGGRLRLTSDLLRSRGYGSSTADIGATLFALGQAMGQPLAPEEVARLAVSIEPSDSTLFPGLTLFDHRGGSFYEHLGPAGWGRSFYERLGPAGWGLGAGGWGHSFYERLGPAPSPRPAPSCLPRVAEPGQAGGTETEGGLAVIVLDPGGEVDTLAFNRVDHRETLRRLAPEHRQAFTLLREGLKHRDWEALGQAATLSACAHQAILPDPLLEPVLALAREVGALGVCRAHSGTLLGLLLDPLHADVPAVAAFVARRLPAGVTVAHYPLVDGGPRYKVDLGAFDHKAGTRVKPAVLEVQESKEKWYVTRKSRLANHRAKQISRGSGSHPPGHADQAPGQPGPVGKPLAPTGGDHR